MLSGSKLYLHNRVITWPQRCGPVSCNPRVDCLHFQATTRISGSPCHVASHKSGKTYSRCLQKRQSRLLETGLTRLLSHLSEWALAQVAHSKKYHQILRLRQIPLSLLPGLFGFVTGWWGRYQVVSLMVPTSSLVSFLA